MATGARGSAGGCGSGATAAASCCEPAAADVAGTAACAAAKERLTGVAGVLIQGLPKADYNSVYLPAGVHEGWLRF